MSSEVQKSQKIFNFFPVLLISFVILMFWLIPDLAILLHGGEGGPGFFGVFTYFAIPATVIAPLAYGWFTRDTTGSVLLGLLPFLLTMIIVRMWSGFIIQDTSYLIKTVIWIGLLCVIGGLEGFCAVQRKTGPFIGAAALAGLWIFVFLSGIN